MATYPLAGCRLDLSAPVEVGRAPGHHWFSTLHPLSGTDVLCVAVTAADVGQGQWPAILYRSRDGGRSWRLVTRIDSYGPSSLRLGPDRLLLMPYELWPLAPGDRRNATARGTLIACAADGAVGIDRAPVTFRGFPRDLAPYNRDQVFLLTNGNILPVGGDRLLTTIYGRFLPAADRYECVAVCSRDGGTTWHYLSRVAQSQDTPGAAEGPNESNTARLPDGRLLCVYRVGSGRQYHYHCSYSADQGRTWTRPRPMRQPWSVEPQLVCLESGVLLLSGGRPGLMLWACTDGRGDDWQALDLAAHHNAAVTDPALHFAPECLGAADAGTPACTTSYTCMKAIGPDEVLLSYDRLGNGWDGAPGPRGPCDVVFTVRVGATLTAAGP